MLWSLDLYSECNTGHANSQINDDPKLGQHGMQDCAFEIDNGWSRLSFARPVMPSPVVPSIALYRSWVRLIFVAQMFST